MTSADPSGVRVHRDVRYAVLPGYRPLSLDLYVPESGARAVCLYLHGGGWRVGSRRAGPGPMSPTSSRFFVRAAQRGLAMAVADYRLSGEARFPAQIEDVATAYAFVAQHGAEHGIDADRGTVWGVSAGGLLAALLALDAGTTPEVSAAVCWYPVTDILSLDDDIDATGEAADRSADSREALLLGGPTASLPELARAASPVHQTHPDAPPFLLVHGSADVAVPIRQSERLAAALEATGNTTHLDVLEGYGHMFVGMPDDELDRWVDASIDFLLDPSTR